MNVVNLVIDKKIGLKNLSIVDNSHVKINIIEIDLDNENWLENVLRIEHLEDSKLSFITKPVEFGEFYFFNAIKEIEDNNAAIAIYDCYEVTDGLMQSEIYRSYNPDVHNINSLSEEQKIARILHFHNEIELAIFDGLYIKNKLIAAKKESFLEFVINCLLDKDAKEIILCGGFPVFHLDDIKCIQLEKLKDLDEICEKNFDNKAIRSYCLFEYIKLHRLTSISEIASLLEKRIKNLLKSDYRASKEIISIIQSLFGGGLGKVDKVYDCQNKKYKDLSLLSSIITEKSFSFALRFSEFKFRLAVKEHIKDSTLLNELLSFSNLPLKPFPKFLEKIIIYYLNALSIAEFNKIPTKQRFLMLSLAKSAGLKFDCNYYFSQIDSYDDLLIDPEISSFLNETKKDKFNKIYEFLKREEIDHKAFEEWIKNKTIAIVGNGPTQLKKRTGKEIDANEIVVRFNNYELDSFADDYGTKENVWAISMALNTIYRRTQIGSFDFVLVVKTSRWITPSRIDVLINMQMAGIKIVLIDSLPLILSTNIRLPSTGLIVIDYICRITDKLKVKTYGFDFNQKEGIVHYFNNDPSQGKILSFHKWDLEKKYFCTLTHR